MYKEIIMSNKNMSEKRIPEGKQMQFGVTRVLRRLSDQNNKLKKIISEFESDQAKEESSDYKKLD